MTSLIARIGLISAMIFSTTACLSNEKINRREINNEKVETNSIPSHHMGDKFRNPYLPADFQPSFIAFLKARLFDDMQWPNAPENHREFWQPADLKRIQNPPSDRAQATLIGHSTVLLQHQGQNILTDPIFSQRASFSQSLGPKRYTPPSLSLSDLPDIDVIVISHNHYDHLDIASVLALAKNPITGNEPLWLVPLGLKAWFSQLGISKIKQLDWWQSTQVAGLTVQAQPSQHWSRRSLFDTNKSLWASWAFIWPEAKDPVNPRRKFTAWFGGDTAYNPYQFKEIGEALVEVDLAMIPIGAYEPRWFMKTQHVNPLDAVEIFKDINAKSAFGIHWNTFVLTAEAVDEPPKALARALLKNGVNEALFQAMPIGETWTDAAQANKVEPKP